MQFLFREFDGDVLPVTRDEHPSDTDQRKERSKASQDSACPHEAVNQVCRVASVAYATVAKRPDTLAAF